MNNRLLLFVVLLCSTLSSKAQTSLAPGDISIIGFNSGLANKDGHAFVSWVPLLANTVIRFTDNAFNGTGSAGLAGNYRNAEQTVTWTTTVPVAAGTVITIEGDGTSPNVITNIGTVSAVTSDGSSTTSLGLTNNGDQIFAFQGTVLTTTNTAATFPGTVLYGVGWQGVGAATGWLTSGTSSGQTSYLPTEIASYGLFFAASAQGGEYTGSRTGLTMAQFKAAVNNPANWTPTTTGVTTYNTTAFTSTPLNVSLSSFTARNENGIAGLYWKTESEMENAGFDIEAGNDGKIYRSIGFVSTKAVDGNSNTTLSYTFQDKSPATGTNFYRLVQKDKSGKISYSATVSINFDKPSGFVCYPNPVQSQMTLQYTSDKQEKLNIGITDITGKIVLSKEIQSAKGFNQAVLDLSGFSQGLYNITVTSGSDVMYTSRISKN